MESAVVSEVRALDHHLGDDIGTLLGWHGSALGVIRLANVDLLAFGVVNTEECCRRASTGLTFLEDRSLLETLSELPLHAPIPRDAIDVMHLVVLDSAPAGVLTWEESDAVREFQPVVELTGLIAVAHTVRDLEKISLFAADAARAIVVEDTRLVESARRLDISVVHCHRGQSRILAIGSAAKVRPGARRWWVQERVWAQICRGYEDASQAAR